MSAEERSKGNRLFSSKDRMIKSPLLLGRLGRFIFGLWSLYFVREAFTYRFALVDFPDAFSQVGYLMGAALAFWLMPDVINIGLNRNWGSRSQFVWFGFALIAIVVDFVTTGSFIGQYLGWAILIMGVFVHSYLGISHVLSAIIGTPGCEMRSIPHLGALLSNQSVGTVVCPGHWTSFDRWESSLWSKT